MAVMSSPRDSWTEIRWKMRWKHGTNPAVRGLNGQQQGGGIKYWVQVITEQTERVRQQGKSLLRSHSYSEACAPPALPRTGPYQSWSKTKNPHQKSCQRANALPDATSFTCPLYVQLQSLSLKWLNYTTAGENSFNQFLLNHICTCVTLWDICDI